MSDPAQRWRRAVHGFGSHVEMRKVEFMDSLDNRDSCFWCTLVSSRLLQLHCRHVICDLCAGKYGVRSDYRDLASYIISCCDYSVGGYKFKPEDWCPGDKQVRCVNAGCDFMGRLKDLNEHLRKSCAMYSTTCSKCEERFAYKDLRKHYTECGGKPAVFLSAVDVRTLLDNFGAAFNNLKQAVASARPDDNDALRDTVSMVSEQFARIQEQLDTGVPAYMPASRLPRPGP
ncbi:uncharacterized protein LOC125760038 [Rhipicephalus sanguineus]|uniref:Uncharacterized protein n=1 Tax=Rhipicephalus sanguineus TaxID=34632 RepID=A0A9D4QEN2_RHISA|nr:uncharacterized protein LOC125760038 [Rhipicephalus sanguineus]XP_049275585.1 uncharacterized protein LOC125760038 [Rhipicephalus sanguineus]KAH7976876.1 hypothetical protein HPB52_020842 [Rhipicephalus sanguineus]